MCPQCLQDHGYCPVGKLLENQAASARAELLQEHISRPESREASGLAARKNVPVLQRLTRQGIHRHGIETEIRDETEGRKNPCRCHGMWMISTSVHALVGRRCHRDAVGDVCRRLRFRNQYPDIAATPTPYAIGTVPMSPEANAQDHSDEHREKRRGDDRKED